MEPVIGQNLADFLEEVWMDEIKKLVKV